MGMYSDPLDYHKKKIALTLKFGAIIITLTLIAKEVFHLLEKM